MPYDVPETGDYQVWYWPYVGYIGPPAENIN